MHLSQLADLQAEFDSQHQSAFAWDQPITKDDTEMLKFLLISLAGECGELADVVKKVLRGDLPFEDATGRIEEEAADIFIYLVKLANQLGFSLETAFLNKLDANRLRFHDYCRRACKEEEMTQKTQILDQVRDLQIAKYNTAEDLRAHIVRIAEHIESCPNVVTALAAELQRDAMLRSCSQVNIVKLVLLGLLVADAGSVQDKHNMRRLLAKLEGLSDSLDIEWDYAKHASANSSRLQDILCSQGRPDEQ